MRTRQFLFRLAGTLALPFAASLFIGCASTDSGSSSSTTVYYGAAFYDPWYYHGDYDYDYDHDVIVTPPPINRPPSGGGDFAPRPEHPIALPPGESSRPSRPSTQPTPRPPSVSARPMPSIPSGPRVAPRGGGRR